MNAHAKGVGFVYRSAGCRNPPLTLGMSSTPVFFIQISALGPGRKTKVKKQILTNKSLVPLMITGFLFFTIILSSSFSFAQDKNKIFQEFKSNYSFYWQGAKFLLGKTKIDPLVTKMMDKALPKIADQDVAGAIKAMSGVIGEKKNIKELNPKYVGYLEPQFKSLIKSIGKEDYVQIVTTICDVALVSNDYLVHNIVPENNISNQKALAVVDTNQIKQIDRKTGTVKEGLYIKNSTHKPITVCIGWYSDSKACYMTMGWYNIPVGETIAPSLKFTQDKETFYYHAKTQDNKTNWGGEYKLLVNSEKFKIYNADKKDTKKENPKYYFTSFRKKEVSFGMFDTKTYTLNLTIADESSK